MILIRPDRTRDGLVGLTDRERAVVAERIARAREAKARGLDGFGVIAAIEATAAEAPRRRCSRCRTPLPATEAYFYRRRDARRPKESLRSECKSCGGRLRREAREAARRADGDAYGDAKRAADREYRRRQRAGMRAAGISRPRTPRERLIERRRHARKQLEAATGPVTRARIEARIAGLSRLIEAGEAST